MIGISNPNLPTCERCGDICGEEEMSLDHPELCLVCADKVETECAPRRNDIARCEDCEHEWRVQHMSVIHPACCVWCAKARISAENMATIAASLIADTEPAFSAERDQRRAS